ncbi:hypothetical protein nbrc107697_07750 [Gordonia crocea]|uniref:DUF5642 domain-containing protein n=1 Tax=Gordonia crocea TaxID=589162 RepID=A0A7M3SVR2_9ACTN|nr:hypothetical protein nbrc107697_07750 [Gordonia crocea]
MAAAVVAVAVGLVGCSSTVDLDPPKPGAMLLAPTALPSGFTATATTVAELAAANAGPLAEAAHTPVVPADCRPTADAGLNGRLDDDTAAVLTARSSDATLSNLVVAGPRDIDADVREHTGACATTRTTLTTGGRAGAVVIAEHRKLAPPVLSGAAAGRLGLVGRLTISQMFLFRADTTTTLPDGTTSRSVSFAGYAAAHAPGSESAANRFTIALTVSGDPTGFAKPFPEVTEPMSDKGFVELFVKALTAAGQA